MSTLAEPSRLNGPTERAVARRRGWAVLAVIGLVLVIFGVKLGLIGRAGSDLPMWDQWDSEAEITLRPWLEGRLTAHDILRPHSEHRIATTKLYALGLVAANGEWDNVVETTGGALIHAGLAAALLVLVWRWLRTGWAVGGVALLLALFTLPFDSDNTLIGFQLQFYFLLWFAVLHVWLTLRDERFSVSWLLGQVCGGLGLVSMGSGFLSGAAILGALGWQAGRTRRLTAQQVVSAVLSLGLVVLGYCLINIGPGLDATKAHSVTQFIWGLLQMLTWPWAGLLPGALVVLWPGARFVARCVRQRELAAEDRWLLALYAWVVLQCVAVAYARSSATVLTSRYYDILVLNLLLSGIFLVREWPAKTVRVYALLWLVAVGAGLGVESNRRWEERIWPLPAQNRRREENLRTYLRTRDPEVLRKAPGDDLPYPSVDALLDRLKSPALRQVMPPSVRPGEPVLGDEPAVRPLPAGAKTPDGARYWSSWSTEGRTTWRSTMQSATALPVLRFRVMGDLGPNNRGLRLMVKSASGEVAVVPDKPAGTQWKTVNVTRPAGEWWIEAATDAGAGWLAFTEPIQVGRLSWLAGKLIKAHEVIFALGAGLLVLGGLGWMIAAGDPETAVKSGGGSPS